jgi:hypothetical protein
MLATLRKHLQGSLHCAATSKQVTLCMQVHPDHFVFLSEADFLVPNRMHQKLASGASGSLLDSMRAAWAQRGERHAMIVPAFERLAGVAPAEGASKRCARAGAQLWPQSRCLLYQGFDVPLVKAELQAMVNAQSIAVFHEGTVCSQVSRAVFLAAFLCHGLVHRLHSRCNLKNDSTIAAAPNV